ncbi:MAG TPA: DNA-directed RNA polymerase subunit beta', partial [Chitinophagales bacterium]|nr:DNA-directed RNA polymerase subunit beta' [Chitinophagales bacterium]
VVKGEGKAFYSAEEVIIAYNEGKVDLHAYIKCKVNVLENDVIVSKVIETTVGRVMFNEVVPAEVGFINALLSKKAIAKVIGEVIRKTDVPRTAKFLDDIKDLGFRSAFRGGLSFNISDLVEVENKSDLVAAAQSEVDEVISNHMYGVITQNERYNQIIDIWSRLNTRLTGDLINRLTSDKKGFNSVFMMLDSGARGSKEQIRQLGAMRGLMAKPRKSGASGEGGIIENPILSNLKSGLSVLEYFISTHGARKGLADTALKTADAGYLTRRLVDVAQDVVITEEDCGTLRGISIAALKDNEDIVEPLSERIIGRTSLHNVFDPLTDELIVAAGELITDRIAARIDETAIEFVEIRSVLTCESKKGVCVKCYGTNLANNRVAQKGDAVGIIAAQSIGEPGTQLTLRTFHVGGVAGSIDTESKLVAKFDGKAEFDGLRFVETKNEEGKKIRVVIGRTGEIKIIEPKTGKMLISNNIPYGSILSVSDGDEMKKGDVMCSWDPFNAVIISEFAGFVSYEHIIEGITYREESDEQTGHREKVISESRDKTKIPTLIIKDKKGNEVKGYNLPVGAHIAVEEGEEVKSGQTIAKIPRALGKVRDITGGLPRVTELFEARNPSNPAVVAEIDGVVAFGKIKRGNREIEIESRDGEKRKYLVPLSKQILVQENDYVYAGMPLSDGAITPSDILAIKGPYAVQEYIVNEIQEVYRLQGVKINDKHIETIVRQMMRKMTITDAGDTRFLEDSSVDKLDFLEENDRIFDKKVVTDAGDSTKLKAGQIVTLRQLREENSQLKRADKKPVEYRDAIAATATPLLLGITRASLGTQSWISAASFQETTKVLSTASISAKTDYLMGLKENVIVGHQIPAGTGQRELLDLVIGSKEELDELNAAKKRKNNDGE